MARWERVVTVICFVYVVVYGAYFMSLVTSANFRNAEYPLMPSLHLLGMALSLLMVILVIRDILRRSFPDPNAKVAWALLVVFGNVIAIPIYLWKYGFRPRPEGR
jgi:hypothetical protein